MDKALTAKQAAFVVEYVKDHNATKAAIAAGYSKKTAKSQGQRLLTNVDVDRVLKDQLKAQTLRSQVTGDRILAELYRIATVDVLGLLDERGALRPMSEIPEDLRRAIVAVEISEIWEFEGSGPDRVRIQVGELKKVKLAAKERGLELLAKHLKLLTEKLEVDAGETLEALLTAGRPELDKDRRKELD